MASSSRTASICSLFNNRFNSRKQSSIPFLISKTGEIITSASRKCSEFSISFSYDTAPPFIYSYMPKCSQSPNHISNINFTLENIHKAITRLKHSYSICYDGLPPSLLKYTDNAISQLLLKLYGCSILDGIYPAEWKVSFILPRHKAGSKTDVTNYRPIHLTSPLSRVMESIIAEQLNDFLYSNGILNKEQYGFSKYRSCATCHLDLLNFITTNHDAGLSVIVFYFDLKKAFDSVPHHKLLYKLESAGVTGPLLKWFSSFLCDRTQIVKIDHAMSAPVPITSGVIQGSVLGPLLFLIYINDIIKSFSFGYPFLYADDLKLAFAYHKNDSSITDCIQKDLDNLQMWFDQWNMTLNVDKSGYMQFSKNDLTNIFQIDNQSRRQLFTIKE